MKKDKIASYIVNAVAIAALFILGQYMTTSGMLSRYYTGIVMMVGINIILTASLNPVSYTHLDVYKRQGNYSYGSSEACFRWAVCI